MLVPRIALTTLLLIAAAPQARGDDADPPPAAAEKPDAAKLVEQLASDDVGTRRKAVYALWKLGAEAQDAAAPLAGALLDADAYVRTTAAKALAKHSARFTEIEAALGRALTSGAADVRLDAAKFLAQVPPEARPIDAIVKGLADPNPEVRANAAAALIWTAERGKPAVAALLAAVTEDDDERVRKWAAQALGSIDGAKLVAPMVEALADDDAVVRANAAGMLGYGGPAASGAASALGRALRDQSPAVRAAAASALGAVGPEGEIDRVIAALDDPDKSVRDAALGALNRPLSAATLRALPKLTALLDSEDAPTRAAAATALASIDPLPAIAKLAALLRDDPDGTVRQAAAFGLSNAGLRLPDGEIATLANALGDSEQGVRMVATSALGRLGRRAANAAPAILRVAAAEDDAFSRQSALFLLPRIGIDPGRAVELLSAGLAAKEPMVRSAAAQALAAMGSASAPAASPLAECALRDADPNVRGSAALALGKIGPAAREAAAPLSTLPADAPYLLRVHAAYALAATAPEDAANGVARLVELIGGDPWLGTVPVHDLGLLGPTARAAEPKLLALLRQRENASWTAAAVALCRIGGPGAEEALDALIAGAAPAGLDTGAAAGVAQRRAAALYALSELPAHAARTVPALVSALGEPDRGVRITAARALAALGAAAEPAIPALERAAKDPDVAYARLAEESLLAIRSR